MKKKLVTILTIISVVACIGFAIPLGGTVYAMELNNDECDTVFWENLSELYEGDNNTLTVSATKEIVYDIDLNELGFVYDFYANNKHGYAIIIYIDGQFEALEFFFDSFSPYANVKQNAYSIYVSTMIYLVYDDGKYYFADKDYALTEEIVSSMRNIAFRGSTESLSNYVEYIYFTDRFETNYGLANRHPGLVEVDGLVNACASIAGGNLIQYWDRYNINLITDYTPGTAAGNFYLYKERSSITDAVITQLYSDMGATGTGTTTAQFISGIKTYCARQGYTATFTSCMSSGSFSYITAKQQLTEGKPIALFLDMFTVNDFTQYDGYELLTYIVGSCTHVMAGFGYKEVTYNLMSGGIRQDNYIAVASGFNIKKRGFFNIDYSTQIDDAYSLSVA